MNCPECRKEVVADRLFCTWCERYMPNPPVGTKAGVGRRLAATLLDGILFWMLFFIVALPLAGVFGAAGATHSDDAMVGGALFGAFLAWIAYMIVLIWFLSKGFTPGKFVVGLQVVDKLTGGYPGLWKMWVREAIGKFASGLFLGIGYFWAIWDKDNQAWHDKIASSVVIRRTAGRTTLNPSGTGGGVAPSPVASRFCTECGNRLEAGLRFCPSCGSAAEQ